MVSFVAWKRRQLSERLAARLIGLFWFASAERILCCWFSSRWFSSRKLREQVSGQTTWFATRCIYGFRMADISSSALSGSAGTAIFYQGVTLGEHEHPP